jgi:ribosomal protein S12 methylthiotransferase
MTKKVFISTLGCSKNQVDSDVLTGQLKDNAFNIVDNADESDVIVVNTCGFIESAKEESIDAILEAIDLKKKMNKEVIVAGCLSARYKEELLRDIPEIDAIFGTEAYQEIVHQLDDKIQLDPNTYFSKRSVSTDHHFAYMKISEGCNHKCSFCAIPSMRGKHRSRPIEDLCEEARTLAKRGCKELILIAQDATYYGLDHYKKQKLAELLNELSKVDGIEWIRIMYSYPLSFPMNAIDEMKQNSKVCNYVDMPLQHVSDHMLNVMNRGTKKEYTMRVLREIREKIPNIAFRTTFIVGHPGETEEDHQEMIEFIKEFRFKRLGVFTYSDEDGTKSYDIADKIPMNIKIERMNAVMEVQRQISLDENLTLVDTTIPVLIDSYDSEQNVFIGRSEFDAPEIDNEVVVDYHDRLNIGSLVNIHIYDASEYELYGKYAH